MPSEFTSCIAVSWALSPRKNESDIHVASMSLPKQAQNNYHEIYPQTFLCHINQQTTDKQTNNSGVGQYLAKIAPWYRRLRGLALPRKGGIAGYQYWDYRSIGYNAILIIQFKTEIWVPTLVKNLSFDEYPAINPNSLFWREIVAS